MFPSDIFADTEDIVGLGADLQFSKMYLLLLLENTDHLKNWVGVLT